MKQQMTTEHKMTGKVLVVSEYGNWAKGSWEKADVQLEQPVYRYPNETLFRGDGETHFLTVIVPAGMGVAVGENLTFTVDKTTETAPLYV